MSNGKFVQGTTITVIAGALSLLVGVGTSVILARVLGPEGKGIYTLAMLLPSLIVTFGNLGIGPATVYYVACDDFQRQKILGNNILLSLGTSILGILAGLVIIIFFKEIVVPGVSPSYLLLALILVPVEIFFSYVRYLLLGAQRIKEFNYIQIAQSVLFLGLIALALLGLKARVTGAILAAFITWFLIDALSFYMAKKAAGGIDIKPDAIYVKRAATYGLQVHLANILGFINYRIDIFMVNGFLDPAAVGLYTVGVGLVAKLWLISQAASTVLFPKVAAETKEEGSRKEFTSLVARTVLWTTALAALVLSLLSRWIVLLLYSEAYLPAVEPLQALIIGIVALSASRVLSNDLAGRGYPILNVYSGLATVTVNVLLNTVWIPRLGIVGAAWASTVSYFVSFFLSLIFYCRISGNRWLVAVVPQRGDLILYWSTAKTLCRQAWSNIRRFCEVS